MVPVHLPLGSSVPALDSIGKLHKLEKKDFCAISPWAYAGAPPPMLMGCHSVDALGIMVMSYIACMSRYMTPPPYFTIHAERVSLSPDITFI